MRKIFLITGLVGSLMFFSGCAALMKAKFDFPDVKSVELSERNPDKYIKGPVQCLLIEEEWRIWKKEVKKIKDPELRQLGKKRFVEWIWQRRSKELKKRFIESVICAEKEFCRERIGIGWRSDRGKILIIFGPPDAKSTFTPIFGSFRDTLETWNDPTELAETWIYNNINELLVKKVEIKGLFSVHFRRGTHEGWELAAKIPYWPSQPGQKMQYDTYVSIRTPNFYVTDCYTSLLRAMEEVKESYIIDRDLEFEDVFVKWVPVEENKKKK